MTIYSIYVKPALEVFGVVIPMLMIVAYVTVAERKTMAYMQRRFGPNAVGVYGLLQAFADALKLLLKEYISPSQSNLILFFIGPIVTLIFSLLAYAVVPFGPGITVYNSNLGIIYLLVVSSLSTYGILLAGWSANSKYAFLGSLRSTAQLISYELVLSSAILLVVFFTGSLNLVVNIEAQRATWFMFPLFPLFIIFLIGSIAETNRAPFDLAEAESELVSGFMTEHSAVIFVFFFLAEYASIVFMCILISILFLGGYLYDIVSPALIYKIYVLGLNILSTIDYMLDLDHDFKEMYEWVPTLNISTVEEGMIHSLTLGLKTCIMIFIFIWVRASFPRIRYDQLMSYCWTVLLPLVIALIILLPCLLYNLDIMPISICL